MRCSSHHLKSLSQATSSVRRADRGSFGLRDLTWPFAIPAVSLPMVPFSEPSSSYLLCPRYWGATPASAVIQRCATCPMECSTAQHAVRRFFLTKVTRVSKTRELTLLLREAG